MMINFFIRTYGCQANVADSQALANYLTHLGCDQVDHEGDADIIFVNTCAIRDKAEQKVFSYLGELAEYKKEKKHLKIGVIGCIASYRKKEFVSRFDHVNFAFGAKEDPENFKNEITEIILKLQKTKQVCTDYATHSNLILGGFKDKPNELKQSFVNVMTGCNNYCSYCIVPFTRGREKSYPIQDILQRVTCDVSLGAREVALLGQNVNSYRDPNSGKNFAYLLEQVACVPGEFWVKFVSPHPKDMTKDVLHVMAQHKDKLCAYVHHPLQSGSNKILQAMNRTYTIEQYLEQIDWIRDILPDATITTDVIVGFPGETNDDYLQTMAVIEKVKFDNVYSFIYSPRKYTKAAQIPDKCTQEEKTERLNALQERQTEICKEKNCLNLGKFLKCLVEKRLTNGKLLARTSGNMRVLFDGSSRLIGNFVTLEIIEAGAVNLIGSLINL
jgi:tRNA-2-methylthio-N6-dimethylallyladenosine synthase